MGRRSSQGDVVEFTAVVYQFREWIWKQSVRFGQKHRSAWGVMGIDVDSTVDGVYGNQEGAERGLFDILEYEYFCYVTTASLIEMDGTSYRRSN